MSFSEGSFASSRASGVGISRGFMSVSRLFLLALTSTALALEIRVSPDGPITSLQAARDAIRAARTAGDASDATVLIASGTYAITEPLVLGPGDSRVSFRAEPGAKAAITGGRAITGWREEGGLWVAKVDPAWRFEALWIDGERATRARTPNRGFIQATGQPTELLPGVKSKGEANRVLLAIEPAAAQPLGALSEAELREVNVNVRFSWDVQRHRLAGVRVADGTLQFTAGLHRAFFSLEPYHNVRLENFRAALDEPGEWFRALDGTVFYQPQPGQKLDSLDAWAPVAEQWLVLRGDAEKKQIVTGVSFHGLAFRHLGWTLPDDGAAFGQAEAALGAGVEADGARGLRFEDCEFAHTMTNALWFRHGVRDVTIARCHLHDLGAGGVKIGETKIPATPAAQTGGVTIEDTIIHGGGRHFPGAIGVTVFHSADNTIRHCDIADFYYSAISLGWTWGYKPTPCRNNRVEFCHLHHLGWGEMSDMGAVYTLGPQPGTWIKNCHVHNIACASYGGWGLYNDEGSTGIVWENNLVHRTQGGGYHQHYGRGNVIRNNIFAFNREFQVRRSRPEEFPAFSFEQNIVLWSDDRAFGHVDENWFDGRVFVNRNLYWRTSGTANEFAGKSWDEWRFAGHDAESFIADPRFVDAAGGNWDLRPDSPAKQIGFAPFDWRAAGVRGDDAWKKLAAKSYPPVTFAEKPKPRPLTLREGFETTPLGAKPANGARVSKKLSGIMAVVRGGSAGERCLELRDAPDLEPAWEPHFYYVPHHETGTTRVAFDVKIEPAYSLNFEWRDDAQPYRTGPQLIFEQGQVKANGRKLLDLPPDGWLRVEVEAKLGEQCDATWTCTLTAPDGAPQKFNGLKFSDPEMRKLDWLGWSSHSKTAAKAWFDELAVENRP